MVLIIDFQGFKIENNEFVVKELAAYDGYRVSHYVFERPFDFKYLPRKYQKQSIWLSRHYHGIDWVAGDIPLSKLDEILNRLSNDESQIYIKGREKANYLRRFINKPLLELDEQPRLIKGSPMCFYHTKANCVCSLFNVYYLYECFINKSIENKVGGGSCITAVTQ